MRLLLEKQGSGYPKTSTENKDRRLFNYLRDHPFETSRDRIQNSDIGNCCAANKIILTERNKQGKLEFAREYLNQINF